MSGEIYANSQKQLLSHHLFAVGYVAAQLIETFIGADEKLKLSAFLAGCLHDLGKVDPQFQTWLNTQIGTSANKNDSLPEDGFHIVDEEKFSFEKHPRHNEISLWIINFLNLSKVLSNKKQNEFIEHAVYWHHAKPIRKEEYTTLGHIHKKIKSAYKDKGMTEILKYACMQLEQIKKTDEKYAENPHIDWSCIHGIFDTEIAYEFKKINLPEYKQYDLEDDLDEYVDQVLLNSKANIVRACVISADRTVSALTADQLESYINNGKLFELAANFLKTNGELGKHISTCLTRFEEDYPDSDRNRRQTKAAKDLLEIGEVAVLNGPAGCGKTKIALEWAKLGKAKKIIWVCPRVQVCEGLYQDLTSEEYLPKAKIEMLTGEFKYTNNNGKSVATKEGEEFSGDIILTTIDQVINNITTHTKVTALIDFMASHVVFDEYHEYVPMAGFNLLFSELIQSKKLMGANANTLLVSATPNPYFVENILDLDSEDFIAFESSNGSQYQLKFKDFDEKLKDESNPLFSLQPKNSIVISNTATVAQQAFIEHQDDENGLLFHGKFKVSDKQMLFEEVYQSFKHSGNRQYSILRSGPIVQASLNITCDHMVTEFTTAENWLQRLGRLDRFGENTSVNIFLTATPSEIITSKGKVKSNCAHFLNTLNSYYSAYAWFDYLQSKLTDKTYTIGQIYHLYQDFYQSQKGKQAVEQDLIAALKNSVKTIKAKVHDPVRFIKNKKASDRKKIKKSSLRGDSRFVQMAILNIKNKENTEFANDYAMTWQHSDVDFSNCYTESLDTIRNTGLLGYMAKKHGRVDKNSPANKIPASKMNLRKQILENAAVDPESPIFLSYTPKDLSEKLGEKIPEENATYYVIGSNQVIGSMPLAKINNNNL
ncbi:CRISPR-associated endonuclease/helicase Cas3 [Maridesulfovibrio ferrireducens]|uniref:CRISPR-associated endonuclease/helicase Cas3 n=1 Tax=Maridesulfovibrio ferrireducens TaxID=246191 RepID=A0A1G9KYA8_9BACT|nr:CRISPR-associated endonuclease Cas3'' [Maridesulfovibrio ferrireducens]SDL54325.1 CRISPR-associated endonuclease/helicase Cas3 [Maridesulfovibrio ferrireducens]